jgi:threonine aldolase
MLIDLRSDTLTKPTPEMRRAMAEAEVGDDVYGEDPTINRLQEKAAALMGKEAALFVPTGSMGNCVSLLSQAPPGSEVICEATCHVYKYEVGSMSALGGLVPKVVPGVRGRMDPDDIERAIQPKIYYVSPTALIELENTHNVAGGAVLDLEYMAAVRALADRHGLPIHLDGARIFNAATALGVAVSDIARYADTVMFCLSKGLCAPVGSLVVGKRDVIERARVHRKRLGGGMRQAGVLAAAGLVALETIPPLLADDHAKVRKYTAFFDRYDFIAYDPAAARTNILIFHVKHPRHTAADLAAMLKERGVLCHPFGPTSIRFVTYRDLTHEMVDQSIEILADLFKTRF